MTAAIAHANVDSHRGVTRVPILRRSETKRTKGMTAKGNCIDSTTWLNTRSLAVPLAIQGGDENHWYDRYAAPDEAPRPVGDAQMQEAFHYDLAG
jgi:hypothetical protein